MSGGDHIVISVLTPVWNTDPHVLRQAIESVRDQSYPYWELILVDDGSTTEETLGVLNHYSWIDNRIRVKIRTTNGGIVEASNDALSMATGDFVALLDHDDLLHPDALGAVVHELVRQPDLDVVYTDEDKVDMEGNRFGAYHKPGWSPELLFGQMVLGHMTVYRTRVMVEAGGFRNGYMGSQDWDLALRITERTPRIKHIARVLYHWRQVPGSTSVDVQAKPYTITAARKATTDALSRRGVSAHIEDSTIGGHFHVRHDLTAHPLVSVVIPTAGGVREVGGEVIRLIDRCLQGLLERTDYPSIEVVLVLSENAEPGLGKDIEEILDGRIPLIVLKRPGSFDFSRMVNLGAAHANGDFILLLNDDIDPITPLWLEYLVGWAQYDGVGAVGAKLLFEDGTVQHTGVVGYRGAPVHHTRGWDDGPGFFGEMMLTKNHIAVTGACLLVSRQKFFEVGGLSQSFPVNFNDVDFCLKLFVRGYRNVVENQAVLYHYESSTRSGSVTLQEAQLFREWWGERMENDPYFTWPRSMAVPPPMMDPLQALRG